MCLLVRVSVQGGNSPRLTKPVTSLPGDTTMSLNKLCLTFILTLVLAATALAGEMECPIAPPTAPAAAPTQASSAQAPSATSEAKGDETSAVNLSVAEAAVDLVGMTLALF